MLTIPLHEFIADNRDELIERCRIKKGFTVGQVVHDYGDICRSVTDLAVEMASPGTLLHRVPSRRCRTVHYVSTAFDYI